MRYQWNYGRLWREYKGELFMIVGYCYELGESPNDFVECRMYLSQERSYS